MKVLGVDPGIKTGAAVVLDVDEQGAARLVGSINAGSCSSWLRDVRAFCVGAHPSAFAVEWHIKVRGSNPNAGAAHAIVNAFRGRDRDKVLRPSPLEWRKALGAPFMRRAQAKAWAMQRVADLGAPDELLVNDHIAEAALVACYASLVALGVGVTSVSG